MLRRLATFGRASLISTTRRPFVTNAIKRSVPILPRSTSRLLFFASVAATLTTAALYHVNTSPIHAKSSEDTISHETFDHVCTLIRSNDLTALRSFFSSHQIHPDTRHSSGFTFLHYATFYASPEVVRYLLSLNPDVNIKDLSNWRERREKRKCFESRSFFFPNIEWRSAYVYEWTPLHYAVVRGDLDIIQDLIKAGADPSIGSWSGHTPKHFYDGENQNEKIKKVLEEAEWRLEQEKIAREKEQRRKYPLEMQLREKIVGQDVPIQSVASAVRRKENGWHDEDRPLVFLFLGSSGIGKTEVAKQLAKYVHRGKNDDAFIRIDMSEFQSKHEVSKFIGSPPGYVGHEEGGQLTKKLRNCPNAVVLLDEVEKAHIDVLTIMLQGRLTDGKGETVDCRNAIFIMTSNLAQQEIAAEAELLRSDAAKNSFLFSSTASPKSSSVETGSLAARFIQQTIHPILRDHFKRDEFLGRINEILYFLPFNAAELRRITEFELKKWQHRAMEKHQIEMTWTDDVVKVLSETGYNVQYGARSIKHEVEKKVVNQIAKAHELDEVESGGKIIIVVEDGSVKVKCEKPSKKEPFLKKIFS